MIEVGAQRGLHQVQVAAQDAVFVEHRDVIQGGENRLFELLLLVGQVLGGQLARQVETGLEQAHQFLGDVGMVNQGAGDIAEVKAQANLLEVTGIGAQQRHVTPRHRRGQHQAVKGIVLGLTFDDVDEGILQGVVELLDIHIQAFGIGEGKVVNPELAAVLVTQAIGEFTQHAQAEVFQDRQDIRQRQRRIGMVELAMQLLLGRRQWLVETHHQFALARQAEQVLHVDHRRMGGKTLAVTGREGIRELAQDIGALGLTEGLDQEAGVIVLPGTAGLNHLFFQAGDIDLLMILRIDAQNQLHPRQYRFGEVGPELAIAGLQALHQDLLDLHPDFRRVDIPRHIHQAVAEAAVGVLAQEQAQLVALLNLHNRNGGAEQLIHGGLEQIVARQHLQHLLQFLAQMRLGIEARARADFGYLAADIGNPADAFGIHTRGVQAHKAALLDHLALAVEFADRDKVRIGRTVHTARLGGLGERQQARFAQVIQGLGLDMQIILAQATAQGLGQAQQRGIVIDQATALGVRLHGKFFVAEEGEVVVQQPAHKHLDFRQLGRVHLELGFVQPGQQLLGTGLHGREIEHRQTHLGEHFQQGFLQGAHLADIGAAVDLQIDQRFLLHT